MNYHFWRGVAWLVYAWRFVAFCTLQAYKFDVNFAKICKKNCVFKKKKKKKKTKRKKR